MQFLIPSESDFVVSGPLEVARIRRNYDDTMNEQHEFVIEIANRLESAGIAYMLTGSMAMTIYATPRMTRDIDVVIEITAPDSEKVVELFESDCYVDSESVRQAILSQSMFNIIHREWIIKADFIVRKQQEYRQVEFKRRQRFDLEGVSIYVASPEDLILSKLLWSKESELQHRDVRAIVDSVDALDWGYLGKWAKKLGVSKLLKELTTHE